MTTIEPGSYYLGDPCYPISSQDDWMTILESADYFKGSGVGSLNGHKIYAMSTKYGDGVYEGNDLQPYAVDSGLIGLTPIQICEEEKMPSALAMGRIVDFFSPADMYKDDGKLVFGEYVIETDPPFEWEDDD